MFDATLLPEELVFVRSLFHMNACPECAKLRTDHQKIHEANTPHEHSATPDADLFCPVGKVAFVATLKTRSGT